MANVLQDLQLDAKELSARKGRLVSNSSKQYIQLDLHSGNVILKEKIDRAALYGQKDPCVLLSEIVLENPLQLHRIEHVPKDTRFPLERAQDPDKGENAVQNYVLSSNKHFRLDMETHNDGGKYAELILIKQLDHEVNPQISLVLSAVDGGIPQKTGTTHIIVDVLDANDSFPQFRESTYKVKLRENSALDTLVTKVKASDKDSGSYADIIYSFSQVSDAVVLRSFRLNKNTGELSLGKPIDNEEHTVYEMNIRATDGGGLSAYCKVIVEIEDENDNAPEVTITSITTPLPEDFPLGIVVALFSVMDRDSGENDRTFCTTETENY
ncbi:hypothetical protein JD844_017109 [Phrynosoma platyrhinos]|uniref:Cadherin domain-containing protein n=1 Tax=Phrynosoma platyrhinos TaxID=52577 RepID=A0ABQ7SLA1_PHRPL|nr:hypothetical protein JD844_017109 [Phrynosoma platyrhinos]